MCDFQEIKCRKGIGQFCGLYPENQKVYAKKLNTDHSLNQQCFETKIRKSKAIEAVFLAYGWRGNQKCTISRKQSFLRKNILRGFQKK